LGEGPWESKQLSKVLRRYKIKAYVVKHEEDLSAKREDDAWTEMSSYDPPLVVVGRTGWFSSALASLRSNDHEKPVNHCYELTPPFQIEKESRDGEVVLRHSPECYDLRFISQETFWHCLSSRTDPAQFLPMPKGSTLAEARTAIEKSVRNLSDSAEFFRWPTTEGSPGEGDVQNGDSPESGLLNQLGYKVGVFGALKSHRRQILRSLLESEALPQVESPDYMAKWGREHSGTRLKKIASSIAAFCKRARGTPGALTGRSVESWEDDLSWLKRTYYDGRFDGGF